MLPIHPQGLSRQMTGHWVKNKVGHFEVRQLPGIKNLLDILKEKRDPLNHLCCFRIVGGRHSLSLYPGRVKCWHRDPFLFLIEGPEHLFPGDVQIFMYVWKGNLSYMCYIKTCICEYIICESLIHISV